MTMPVLSITFVVMTAIVFVFLLLIVVYAKWLIIAALLVLGLLYLKYKREQAQVTQ